MQKYCKSICFRILSLMTALLLTVSTLEPYTVFAETQSENTVFINEVESNGDTTDWVEIYNAGTEDVDISGWYILDNDATHITDVTPVEDTILKPGEFYVFDQYVDFDFGLGKDDSVSLYNSEGNLLDSYSWTAHASGVYARIPDGTGEFVDSAYSTKGSANTNHSPAVINEVQSNDPDGGPDWIELANPTGNELDISGLVLKDNDDTHGFTIPEGTTIEAYGFIVFYYGDDFDFGLGKNDSVRLYEDGELIGETTWSGHTDPTWGLYPNVNGTEYRSTSEATPGDVNKFVDIPETIAWPGNGEVTIYDSATVTDYEDFSGLDFYNGQLYVIDNGTATFWALDVAEDGTLSYADGYESGKRVYFKKDAGDSDAAGPDAEGITVDSNGYVYLAVERDNSYKKVNYNVILMVDPSEDSTELVATQEWDLTSVLPDVTANYGLEAVEFVASDEVNGLLYDTNIGDVFDISNYPDTVADGVFFTALEDNGHVYAFVLNSDGSYALIADIDSQMGSAMALEYDEYEGVLWVVTDGAVGCTCAQVTFNGTEDVDMVFIKPASGLDSSKNYEGFAIADASYTVDGNRPVYYIEDGVTSGALAVGSIYCDYAETTLQGTVYYQVNTSGTAVRFVAEISSDDAMNADSGKIDATAKNTSGATATITSDVTTVYTSVKANGKTVYASDGCYFIVSKTFKLTSDITEIKAAFSLNLYDNPLTRTVSFN